MRIHLIAVGNRMPAWVMSGFAGYAGRMPPECRLELKEVAPGRRSRGCDIGRLVQEEGRKMLEAIPRAAHVVALDSRGREWSTPELAETLARWLHSGQDIALLVGGPEGLAESCRTAAAETWSLSKLTFPHPLVRVVAAEQIYRAWSLLHHHPYHRE